MFKFAIGNLLSRPIRSALSMLGLTVAIAGMVGLFSIAGGVDQLVSSTFELIPGLLVQQRGAPVPLFSTLPAGWETELEELEGVTVVNPQVLVRANVINGKTIISPPRFILGLDIPSRLRLEHGVYNECLESGRFLEPGDAGTMNCVVARQIAEEFGKGLGDSLKVNGHDVTIVGTYYCGSMLLDVSILMDVGSVRNISRFDPGSVSVYYLETGSGANQKHISREIERRFADRSLGSWQGLSGFDLFGTPGGGGGGSGSSSDPLTEFFRRFDRSLKQDSGGDQPAGEPDPDDSDADAAREDQSDNAVASSVVSAAVEAAAPSPVSMDVDPAAESPVEVRSADDWAEKFDEFSADLDLFLTLMTAIGVAIAVLSIVNTMLMSVTERRIEFGILRANGWSRGHVLWLVTFESALLGVCGGLLGAFFGWVATHVINWYFPERVHLHAGPMLLGFSVLFSTGLGILGGVYPAWQAARLSPMEAIRRG